MCMNTHQAVHDLRAANAAISPGRYQPHLMCHHPVEAARRFPDTTTALAWVRTECSRLTELCLTATDRGEPESCWQLAFLLRDIYFLDKMRKPWLDTHRAALKAAVEMNNPWAAAVTLNNLGTAHSDGGDLTTAAKCHERALVGFTGLGDQQGIVRAAASLGWCRHYQGDHRGALEHLTAAAEFHDGNGGRRDLAITLRGIALAEVALQENESAVAHAGAALRICEAHGLQIGRASCRERV